MSCMLSVGISRVPRASLLRSRASVAAVRSRHRSAAYNYIETKLKHNEYVTGLIHIDEKDSTEFHNLNHTAAAPLNSIPYEKLAPGRAALDKLMARYR